MKRLNKILGLSILAGATFFAFFSATSAWFSTKSSVDMNNFEGQSEAAYFAGGDGTSENPYQITNQKHLYNLAWLQYLGYFNLIDENKNIIQTYFTLNDDVDMTGLVLPPIGTTLYPFVGNFDGQGHTIENYTISNEYTTNEIEKKPFRVTNVQDVNIVGMFGVVGDIDSSLEGKYDTSVLSISNFYVDNINVRTKLNQSLIGVVAGYVNGTLENVGVMDASIYINSGTSTFDRFTRLSEFALIGYCENQYIDKVTKTVTNLHNVVTDQKLFTVQETGSQQGWGGSVDMYSLYTRLNNMSYTATRNYPYDKHVYNKIDGTDEITTDTATFYTYKSDKGGSVVLSSNKGQYMYLHGGQRVDIKEDYYTGNVYDSYFISSNGYYLTANGTTGVTRTNNINNASRWILNPSKIDNASSITLYTVVNGTKYYLLAENSGWIRINITLSLNANANNATSFTVTKNNSDYGISYRYNNTDYYVKYNNGFTISTGEAYLTFTYEQYKEYLTRNLDNQTHVDYTSTDTRNTYVPLSSESTTNFNASNKNTGYVISGSDDRTTTGTYPAKSGDIRVSYYTKNGNLSNNTYSNDQIKTIKTIDSSFNNINISNESQYEKLTKSKANFESVLKSSGNNVYGLHFMSATINENSIVNADYAMINGTEYTNYEFPANCVDFNLKEKGYVNFFAGTYFPTNNSFFSLHQIERNGNSISSIKEISQIYMDNVPNHSVVYKYSDNTYSRAYEFSSDGTETELSYTKDYPDGYTLRFDTKQIKVQSNITEDYIYYFEFPMNRGEYALGSVEGGAGAYLMYLDISANALEVTRTKVFEHIERDESSYQVPKGVSLVSEPSDEDILDNKDSACFTIDNGYTGTLSFNRTDNDVVVAGQNSLTAFTSYGGDLVTIKDDRGNLLEPKGFHHIKTIIDRLTMIDYSKTTLDYYYVVVSDWNIFEDDKPVQKKRTYDYISASFEELSDDKKHIYNDEGKELTEAQADSQITIDTSECDELISKYKSTYTYGTIYSDDPFITIQEITPDESGNMYYSVIGYNIKITTSSDVDVVFVYVSSDYVITLNGEIVATDDVVRVLAGA